MSVVAKRKNETPEQKEERLRMAAEAMAEYQARERGLGDQIARLKALRLAEADKSPPARSVRKARKKRANPS